MKPGAPEPSRPRLVLAGGVVGLVLWRLGRKTREGLSEEDRNRVVLGEDE